VLPTDALTGDRRPGSTSTYDDAAAAPGAAPKASVTIIAPPAVKAKPYGV
jgi:hypothetical protein